MKVKETETMNNCHPYSTAYSLIQSQTVIEVLGTDNIEPNYTKVSSNKRVNNNQT